MKLSNIVLVSFVVLLPWTGCYSANGGSYHPDAILANSCCREFIFTDAVNPKEKVLVQKMIEDLAKLVIDKNVNAIVDHENDLIKSSDQRNFDQDESSFLFGETPSNHLLRKSVRQILLTVGKPSAYIESETVWGSYKGDMYLVIFFNPDKTSTKNIFSDLKGNRDYYMKDYAATIVEITPQGWRFPETPFFWETDGP